MAQNISLSVETPVILNDASNSVLPPFGYQRRSASQNHKKRRNIFSTNTLPNSTKQEPRNQSTLKRQADVIRYIPNRKVDDNSNDNTQIELQQKLYFHNVFSPGIHSTPIYKSKSETHNFSNGVSSSSVNNIKQNYQRSPPSLPTNIYLNDYELFKSTVRPGVPSISRKVDLERHTISGSSSVGLESKVIKRRGICGVSWILRLALKENSVGKIYTKQIGWIIFVLIILVLIGGLLVHFSSHFYSNHLVTFTNFTQIPPKIVLIENVTIYEAVKTTTLEPMYSEDANRAILPITRFDDISKVVFPPTTMYPEIYNKTTKKQINETEYIGWREGKMQNITSKLENYTNHLTEFCKGCRKGLEICIAADNGIPVCRPAIDTADPTGCGGLCALEIEACHLLNQIYSVYTCRPLETLQLCEPDEWRCENHLCIPKSKRCDGYINCYDRSDETECSCNLAKNFHCGNKTSCLDISKRCDGTVDCWDGSDELNCTIACPDDQFTCNNGECIQRNLFCDGLADCTDKTDEPLGCGGVCMKHEFKCANSRCIPKSRVCNGADNCGDMSDELKCPNVKNS